MSTRALRHTFSLKGLLTALTVLAAGPLVAISLWFLSSLWEGGREVSKRGLAQTADAMALAVERELTGLIRDLQLLGDSPLLDRQRWPEMRDQARNFVARQTGWDTIALTDREGLLLFDTDWPFGAAVPARELSHIQAAVRSQAPVVSNLYPGSEGHLMAVYVAVPVLRHDGVRWVLEGRLDSMALSAVVRLGLSETSEALVLDRNLRIVARSGDPTSRYGEVIGGHLSRALTHQPERGVERIVSADGTNLLAAWRRVPIGWMVVVSEPLDVRDAPLRYALSQMLAAGALVMGLSVSLSLLLGQRVAGAITAVSADARSLAAGHTLHSRRSAISEISTMFESLEEAGRMLAQSTQSRENALAALSAGEERLMLAIDATDAGTFDWDLRADRREASPRARELFGLPMEGPIGPGSIRASVHRDDLDRLNAARDAALAGQDDGRLRVDCRVTDRSGALRWLECRGQVYFDKDRDGRRVATRMVVLAVDQTERQRSIQALHEADRRKDEFLAMLAHELRNPLAPMRNAISLLERTIPVDSPAGQAVAMSSRQVSQMTRLVNDLLDVSRITQGKIELRRELMPVSDAVADALEAVRPMLTQRGLHLDVHQPDPAPLIDADRVRITQVLENLLSNACKYTDVGGRIDLEVSQDADWAVIRVTDTGIGIPANRLTQIFDLFTQVDVAIDRSQGGLGIGLALVRSLVALHAGQVHAFSPGIGKGSTFEVRLPRAAMPPDCTD